MSISTLSHSQRIRLIPFSERIEANQVKSYSVCNYTLLAKQFHLLKGDCWHLCQHTQVCDITCQRQVNFKGPDAFNLSRR